MDQVSNENMETLTSKDIINNLKEGNISIPFDTYKSYIDELIEKYKDSVEKNEDLDDEDFNDSPSLNIGESINAKQKDNILGVKTL